MEGRSPSGKIQIGAHADSPLGTYVQRSPPAGPVSRIRRAALQTDQLCCPIAPKTAPLTCDWHDGTLIRILSRLPAPLSKRSCVLFIWPIPAVRSGKR